MDQTEFLNTAPHALAEASAELRSCTAKLDAREAARKHEATFTDDAAFDLLEDTCDALEHVCCCCGKVMRLDKRKRCVNCQPEDRNEPDEGRVVFPAGGLPFYRR